MAELINRNDSLNDGRKKLNNAIEKVDTFQDQINTIVVDGDSSVEAAQARVDADNNTYPTLKARLDAKETQTSEQLAETAKHTDIFRLQNEKADKVYVDEKLSKKAEKDTVWNMSNMGQDVKEAMTGGSVAVVGEDSVDTVNLKKGSVTPSKTSKGIYSQLRYENIAPPLSELKDVNGSVYLENTPYYRYAVHQSNGVSYIDEGDGKFAIREGSGTFINIHYKVTDIIALWESISGSVKIENLTGGAFLRFTFYGEGKDSGNDYLDRHTTVLENGLNIMEGIKIPDGTDNLGLYLQGTGGNVNFDASEIVITLGDKVGRYILDFYRDFIGDTQNLVSSTSYLWEKGSIYTNTVIDEAFLSQSNSVIRIKKDLFIENKNYKKLYYIVPHDFMLATAQFDEVGNQVFNSGWLNDSSGYFNVSADAKKIYLLLRLRERQPFSVSDINGIKLYVGTDDSVYNDILKFNKFFSTTASHLENSINDIVNNDKKRGSIPCPIYRDSYLYKYIGHGGLEGYAPSMSVEAYELAALFGMWGIESDAHLTKDNEIVMMHDTTVDRTTDGTGAIADMTLAEIKQLRITQKSDYYDHPVRVPTIDEYLKCCVNHQMVAQIEIKGGVPNKPALIDRLLEKLERYNMIGNTMIIAFQEDTLELVRDKHSQIWVSRIYSGDVTQADIDRWKDLGNFILFNYNPQTDLNEDTINLLNENNIPYLHGVRNDKESHDYIKSLGVPAIATNNFYDPNRPTVKYNAFIETNDNGSSWTYQSINNMVDVNFDTTNDDLRFMFEQVPRNWLKQLQGRVEVEYLGTDDVIVKAFYDDDIKQIRCKFYENGIIKNVGNIPNGKFNVTILL